MKTAIQIHNNRRSIQLLLLLFILALFQAQANNSFAYRDSTKNKSKYGIDDPRNPNCPCHKQQQLAEQEYKRLIAQHKIQPSTVLNSHSDTREKNRFIKKHRVALFVFSTTNHKKKPKKNHKLIKDITACFHWH